MAGGVRGGVLIARPRLSARLAGAPVALIEAPGGYGKSVAWTQLAASLDVTAIRVRPEEPVDASGLLAELSRGCRRAGLPQLAGVIDPDDPDGTLPSLVERLDAAERGVLIGVDEVQRARPDAAAWLADFATALPRNARLVLAGRRLGPELVRLRDEVPVAEIGADDLRFEPDEVATLLASAVGRTPDAAEVDAIVARTGGWPAAVALVCARANGAGSGLERAGGTASALRLLVDDVMARADPDTRRVAHLIAGLPLLSGAVTVACGGEGSLERLLDAGLPVRFRPDGWGELPDPIRELIDRHPLPLGATREVAALYARGGELAEGVGLLHRAEDPAGVVELLAAQTRRQLVTVGLEMLHAVVESIPDEVLASRPELIVSLVQAAERRDRLRSAWSDRAVRVLAEPSAARRAIDVERAMDQARAGDLEGAIVEAGRVLDATPPNEPATRGRARLVRGLSLLVLDTAANLRIATEELGQAIGLFDAAGERDWQAEAHQVLGFGCHLTAGSFALAAHHLSMALSLRSAPDTARAQTLTYLAEALTLQGRLDDSAVALREAASIGRRLGDDRTIAYAAWSSAELACQRRDRVAVVAALEEAEAHPTGWFDQLPGTEFLSHAAEMLATLGEREAAEAYLERATQRAEGSARPDQPLAARTRLAATFGDPGEALGLVDELDASSLAVQRDRWLLFLFRAVCHARMGEPSEAAAWLTRSRIAAAELDDPERLERREPELLAAASPPDGATATTMPSQSTVVLLGRFAVERDGVDVTPPPGRPSTLVKLLALEGTLTLDAAVDALWEDEADPQIGAARLRNLLHRVRMASGPIVVRRDGALALEPGATVDARRFEEEAAVALAAPPEERAGLARRALAWSTGELLPTDRYEDWADAPRERIRRRQLALIDLVAADALARGDLDEAGRLLDAAIATDPLEEQRYVRLARALVAQGRTGRANAVLEQAVAVAAELDVEPSPEIRQMLAAAQTNG